MVGHGVGLEMEHMLDLNMSIKPWNMVVDNDDLEMHDNFWAGSMV